MSIDNLRSDNLPPQSFCRAMDDSGSFVPPSVQPSIPPDHLEPSGIMRRVDERLEKNTVILDTAARWMELAKKWKWVAIRLAMQRPDFATLQREGISIGLLELDHARQEAPFWELDQDSAGNIGLERQS